MDSRNNQQRTLEKVGREQASTGGPGASNVNGGITTHAAHREQIARGYYEQVLTRYLKHQMKWTNS